MEEKKKAVCEAAWRSGRAFVYVFLPSFGDEKESETAGDRKTSGSFTSPPAREEPVSRRASASGQVAQVGESSTR